MFINAFSLVVEKHDIVVTSIDDNGKRTEVLRIRPYEDNLPNFNYKEVLTAAILRLANLAWEGPANVVWYVRVNSDYQPAAFAFAIAALPATVAVYDHALDKYVVVATESEEYNLGEVTEMPPQT
jgi:hypothetical protein